MDIYIKMCKGAEEIQTQRKRKWQWGDIYSEYPYSTIAVATQRMGGSNRKYKGDIWLPRQDQYQKMVKEKSLFQLTRMWQVFIGSKYRDRGLLVKYPYDEFSSMDQLWLACVMKQKYGKVWDSEKEEWKLDKLVLN